MRLRRRGERTKGVGREAAAHRQIVFSAHRRSTGGQALMEIHEASSPYQGSLGWLRRVVAYADLI